MIITRELNIRLLCPESASKYLGICRRQLFEIEKNGHIKRIRLPDTRKILFDVFDLDDFVHKLKDNLKN